MKITKDYLREIILEEMQNLEETNNYWRTRYLVQQVFNADAKRKKEEESSKEDKEDKKSDKDKKNKK